MERSPEKDIAILKEEHGLEFPLKAKFKRIPSKSYVSGDYRDEEEVEFFRACKKLSSIEQKLAFYRSRENYCIRLISIEELESIEQLLI